MVKKLNVHENLEFFQLHWTMKDRKIIDVVLYKMVFQCKECWAIKEMFSIEFILSVKQWMENNMSVKTPNLNISTLNLVSLFSYAGKLLLTELFLVTLFLLCLVKILESRGYFTEDINLCQFWWDYWHCILSTCICLIWNCEMELLFYTVILLFRIYLHRYGLWHFKSN